MTRPEHQGAPLPDPAAWIDVTATAAPASRTFYARLFGWDIEILEAVDYGLVRTDAGLAGGIGQAADANPHPAGVVVHVPGADVAAADRARDAGGTLLDEPWELPGWGRWRSSGTPDGHRVGVWTPPS